ncbi:hypothetical protein ACN2EP_06325 [Aliarcobacter butzleri]|uniref:hypothetical protein n=1 Tax=Aliarcobacter butzleri TaxID=28197 RepID=UPI003AFAA858
MINFRNYDSCDIFQDNLGYLTKISKLGYTINKSLEQISNDKMTDFLNEHYYNMLPVNPFASCSYISIDKNLNEALQKEFNLKTFPVYGYIKIKEKCLFKFNDIDINLYLKNNTYFKNHHSWIMFENGQLLDLTLINTLKYAISKNILNDVYEFILCDASKIFYPKAMNLLYEINKESYLKYIPMYCGKLFSQEELFENKENEKAILF